MPTKLPEHNMFYGFKSKLTDEQEDYVNAIYSDEYDIVFCNAPAGTGKTTLSVAVAKLLVEEKRKEELLFVFNPVEEDKMGFRPGDQAEKEREYTIPLRQALIELNEQPDRIIISPDDMVSMKNRGSKQWVQITSHVFARGTNQKDKVVIIDEAQNWTVSQLKKMLTRCHDNCKVVVIGHVGQIDLKNPEESGFAKYIEHFKNMPRAKTCELTVNFRGWLAQHADSL